MISADKIKELAVKKQTTELNIRREYAQHLFLAYFYQQEASWSIFFKGGTALRLIYQNPRFSEDLDFSAPRMKITRLENSLQNTLTEIEREGIGVEIGESKSTSGGYLAVIKFYLNQDEVTVQLEISFRDQKTRGEAVTIASDFIPPYTIMRLGEKQLISQKLKALLARKKPRDFYDLYFILRKENLLPPEEKKVLPQVEKALAEAKISFKKELEQFLPRSHWALIKDFKTVLKNEIVKYK